MTWIFTFSSTRQSDMRYWIGGDYCTQSRLVAALKPTPAAFSVARELR